MAESVYIIYETLHRRLMSLVFNSICLVDQQNEMLPATDVFQSRHKKKFANSAFSPMGTKNRFLFLVDKFDSSIQGNAKISVKK